jgi:hypothetical protein
MIGLTALFAPAFLPCNPKMLQSELASPHTCEPFLEVWAISLKSKEKTLGFQRKRFRPLDFCLPDFPFDNRI